MGLRQEACSLSKHQCYHQQSSRRSSGQPTYRLSRLRLVSRNPRERVCPQFRQPEYHASGHQLPAIVRLHCAAWERWPIKGTDVLWLMRKHYNSIDGWRQRISDKQDKCVGGNTSFEAWRKQVSFLDTVWWLMNFQGNRTNKSAKGRDDLCKHRVYFAVPADQPHQWSFS